MQLYRLLEGVDAQFHEGLEAMEIGGVTIDSRNAKPGDLFICLDGLNARGEDFVEQAMAKGARAFVSEKPSDMVNCIRVEDARAAYAQICKNFYEKACDKLFIIGVTGTNGKTTTTHLIAKILTGLGAKVATVGTLGINFDGKTYDTGFTTPDPHILHKAFREMTEVGVEYVVIEVSAHALALKKLHGIKFEIGVLTNITRDHLDFFKTMDEYAKSKLSFFKKDNMKLGLVCIDDEIARSLTNQIGVPLLTYGQSSTGDIYAKNVKSTFFGTRFLCNCLGENVTIKTGLVGNFNVDNTLAAIGVCKAIGLDLKMVATYLSCIKPIEGRFNVINHPKCNVVIDYAHTPDGLEKVLSCAKELTKGRLIALFGCGGNRDKGKRAQMGKLACQIADQVVLTSDNPRFEDPEVIIADILRGADIEKCTVIENRKSAIESALEGCQKNDTLVILGKGAEQYQEIKGQKIPYNDFDIVYGFFRKRIKEVKGGVL